MRKEHHYYVYILASKRNGTLYIGVTNSLLKRTFQHKFKEDPGSFTAQYGVNRLVYFETYQYIHDAIAREKQMKKWNREWKMRLIEKDNPTWRDLFQDMETIGGGRQDEGRLFRGEASPQPLSRKREDDD